MKHWFDGQDCDILLRSNEDDDGDGQTFTRIYSRKVSLSWEYAVVTYSDDGEVLSWVRLKNGLGEQR